jgi:hypothetical protein
MDSTSAAVAALWTALTFWVTANVEPMPGVWIAAFSGAVLSSFTGPDKALGRTAAHFALALCVGVGGSQLLPEIVPLRSSQTRVAEAFFCALFSEMLIAAVHSGSALAALERLVNILRGAKT